MMVTALVHTSAYMKLDQQTHQGAKKTKMYILKEVATFLNLINRDIAIQIDSCNIQNLTGNLLMIHSTYPVFLYLRQGHYNSDTLQ